MLYCTYPYSVVCRASFPEQALQAGDCFELWDFLAVHLCVYTLAIPRPNTLFFSAKLCRGEERLLSEGTVDHHGVYSRLRTIHCIPP